MKEHPQELIDYLVYFHAERDYFECHEILEEYWKSLDKSENRDVWVGLIQIAVALYHQRRKNVAGAKKMIAAARKNLSEKELDRLGFDGKALLQRLEMRQKEIERGEPYVSLNLPLNNRKLLQRCLHECDQKGLKWQQPSNLEDTYLIHKHTLRDRSDVIQSREEALQTKNQHEG